MAWNRCVKGLVRGLLLVLFLAPAGVADYSGVMRTHELDANYVAAYLTWNQGKGSMAWTNQTSTEPLGGPAAANPPVAGAQYQVDGNLKASTGESRFTPGPDEFTSLPVPATLDLNASRYIRVDLFLSGANPCHGSPTVALDVELWVGPSFLGGGIHKMNDRVSAEAAPSPVSGFGVCSFMVQPEMVTIPAGSEIRLKVIHFAQRHHFQYGLSGEAWSAIRFPVFSAEDRVFRVAAPSKAGGDEAMGGALPLAGVAALAALAPARRRGRPALIVVAVLAMAGCAGPGADPEASGPGLVGGSASQTIVPDSGIGSGLADGGTGALVGLVRDEFSNPVPAAHVSLIGTTNFTDTDGQGKFSLRFVVPGSFKVRIEKQDFLPFEEEVSIVAGKITKVEITLEFLVARVGDARPHLHDYWGGQDVVTLVEDLDVGPIVCENVAGAFYAGVGDLGGRHCRGPAFRLPASEGLEDPKVILPGTKLVEVIVKWDASSLGNQDLDRVGLLYLDNSDDGWDFNDPFFFETVHFDNQTPMYPRARLDPFRIGSSWELNDVGHQRRSGWEFMLFLDDTQLTAQHRAKASSVDAAGTSDWTHLPSVFGPFSVTVRVHRGALGLEPPHPDFWGGADRLTLLGKKTPNDSEMIWVTHPGGLVSSGYTFNYWRPALVPPETVWLEILLEENYHLNDLPMRVRTALTAEDAHPREYKALAWTTREATKTVYRYAPAPGESDHFYAKRTEWRFFSDHQPDDEVAGLQQSADSVTKGNYKATLTVVAHRDPLPG